MRKWFKKSRTSMLAAVLALMSAVSCCVSGCGGSSKNEGRYVMEEYHVYYEYGEMSRSTYEYDDACRLLSSLSEGEYSDGREKDVIREEYVYSEDGKTCQVNQYTNDEQTQTIEMRLNKSKQAAVMVWYDADGVVFAERSCEYDKRGYRTGSKTKILSSEGDDWESKGTYDKNGKVLTYVEKIEAGEVRRYEYTYDKNGFLNHADFWYEGPESEYYQYASCVYDEEENTLEEEWFDEEDECICRYVREYDEHGNNVKTLYYDSFGELVYTETMKYAWKPTNARNVWGD